MNHQNSHTSKGHPHNWPPTKLDGDEKKPIFLNYAVQNKGKNFQMFQNVSDGLINLYFTPFRHDFYFSFWRFSVKFQEYRG